MPALSRITPADAREILARAGSEEITYHLDTQGFIGEIVTRLINGSQTSAESATI